jgi:hypothetical protein
MPKFIQLTEFTSGTPVWVNPAAIFSIFRPEGFDRTTIKGLSLYEHIKETPEKIIALIGLANG